MGQSRILKTTELAPGQTNAFTLVNDTVAALEASTNESLTVTTAVDITMTSPDVLAYALYNFTGATTAITIKFPELIATDPFLRIAYFQNSNPSSVTLRSATTDPSTVVLAAGDCRAVLFVGKIVKAITAPVSVGASAGIPHSIGMYVAGIPVNNTEALRYVFVEPVTIPANFVSSKASMLVNPSKVGRLNMYKNGVIFGTIDISTSGVLTGVCVSTNFIAGDVLTIRYVKIQTADMLFSSSPWNRTNLNATSKPDAFVISDGVNYLPFAYHATLNTDGFVLRGTGANASQAIPNLIARVAGSVIGSNVSLTNINGANVLVTNARPQGGGFIAKCPVGYVKIVNGSVATDSVTVSDGTNSVTFNQPTWADISPTARATNLKALIQASILKVRVAQEANELCLLNYNTPLTGTITRSAVTAGDIVIETFADAPDNTRAALTAGFTQDTTLENLSLTIYGTR
jgi:hypothetical protein